MKFIKVKEAKSFLIIILLLSAQLVGCSGSKSQIPIVNNDQDLNAAGVKLTMAAESVSRSLQELAKIDRAVHPQDKLSYPADPDKIGMSQLGSIDWSGPVAPLVKKIAQASNYKFKILGTSPAIPILISVTAKDTPLADILRDVEYQCGRRASIVIYPEVKTIELRYAKS